MPLVRIDLNKSYTQESSKQIGEIVYTAMEEEINVPKDDKFQIITTMNRWCDDRLRNQEESPGSTGK